jgi:hypothetical protein
MATVIDVRDPKWEENLNQAIKEEMKRARRLNKEARMKAKGTWKNNSMYKEKYSPVIHFDPIVTDEKAKKPKRFSQLPEQS